MVNICAFIKNRFKNSEKASNCCLNNDREGFEKRIKRAIENDEFEVYYQPQYNYNTKKMHGAEALMRWKCPVEGVIAPGCFIQELEKNGLIYEVDKLIWEKVCRDLSEWKKSGVKIPHLSVNISGIDLYQKDFVDYISSLVEKYELEADDLHLEITETVYIQDLKYMAEKVRALQKKGFTVEMDDFGSGYSSLKTLKSVPFDVIKVDMEFVRECETDAKAKSILCSIIGMLQKIEIQVIVEGVEAEEQAELLNRLGCRYMQGYYFGKPEEKRKFEKILYEQEKD